MTTEKLVRTVPQHVSYEFLWIRRTCDYIYSWMFTIACCLLVGFRIRVRIIFSVWLVFGYAHVQNFTSFDCHCDTADGVYSSGTRTNRKNRQQSVRIRLWLCTARCISSILSYFVVFFRRLTILLTKSLTDYRHLVGWTCLIDRQKVNPLTRV